MIKRQFFNQTLCVNKNCHSTKFTFKCPTFTFCNVRLLVKFEPIGELIAFQHSTIQSCH